MPYFICIILALCTRKRQLFNDLEKEFLGRLKKMSKRWVLKYVKIIQNGEFNFSMSCFSVLEFLENVLCWKLELGN